MYKGYILRIGQLRLDEAEDGGYISPGSYKVSANKEKIDDWTDYNDVRHVIYSIGKKTEISFETPDKPNLLTEEEIAKILEALETAKHTGAGLNKDSYMLDYYDPRTGEYVIDKDFTLEDVNFTIEGTSPEHVYYSPVKFTFREVSSVD